MDNREFCVNGDMDDRPSFEMALKLALAQTSFRDIDGYKIDPQKGMVCYWTIDDGVREFPFGNNIEQVIDFAWMWLRSNPKLDSKPGKWEGAVDHDGSNGEGWKLYTEEWGQVGSSYAFVALKPIVCWYGK